MKTRRFLAWLLMLAMVLTGIPFYADDSVAYAAASAPNLSCMTATNELTASGDALVSNSSAHVGTVITVISSLIRVIPIIMRVIM